MNTITISLCKEDRQRLDEVIAFLGLIAGELKSRGIPVCKELEAAAATLPAMTQAEDGTVKLVQPDHPVDAPTTHLEPPAADPAPEVKPVSFAEFQKAVTQAVVKGPKQKAAAKEIVNKYAPSVSEVPEDKRAEVMAELAKI